MAKRGNKRETRTFYIGAAVYASTHALESYGAIDNPAKFLRGTVKFLKRWRDGELHVTVNYEDGTSATVNSKHLGLGTP